VAFLGSWLRSRLLSLGQFTRSGLASEGGRFRNCLDATPMRKGVGASQTILTSSHREENMNGNI
jgi:hypothetical protein